jgi:hypothetical protein
MKKLIAAASFLLFSSLLPACGAQVVEFPIDSCEDNDGSCFEGCDATNDDDCEPVCGNEVIEEGEVCDPQASCPTDCADDNVCTTDTLTGSAATCDAQCNNTAITTCTSNDGCCAPGCDNTEDNDCAPVCGNNVVEFGEACDPQGSCPTSCDDLNACTIDILIGSAANCDAQCIQADIQICSDGDGCCLSDCDSNTDNDCSPTCGNDVVEEGETCDPLDTCPVDCDDTNACTSDLLVGSAANCNAECLNNPIVSCIDDDGCCASGCNSNNDNNCSATCGNGVLEFGEACDPAGTCPLSCEDGDSCTSDILTGSALTCDAQCDQSPILLCNDNDGCCAPGCDINNDNDCDPCDQAQVSLGSAINFAILAGATITSTGLSNITGDMGSFSGTSVSGFPPGTLTGALHAGDSVAGQGIADLTAAFNDVAGRSLCPVSVDGNLGGQTLTPGLYQSTSSLAVSSGDLTLDAQGNGNAIFIFQMASTLTTTAGRQVILINGAKSSNIFWQVGSSATLGTTSSFAGNILADQSISMETGAFLNGRALTRIGAVTLDSNTVVIP